ncbi:MAG TPA: pyrroline-5-carboxylate reductase [Stenotrophomonas sp.]
MTETPNAAQIAFIGGGNMARSLIAGLVRQGVPANTIHVAEPVDALRERLAIDFGVHPHVTASEAAEGCQTWLLAVKPQVMHEVCTSLSGLVRLASPLVVSIAAGIGSGRLQDWLGAGAQVVRAMPNTPALLGAGVTGLYAGAQVTQARRSLAEALLGSAGQTVWIDDEALMDAVTAVSGSGPAYVFLLAEAMQAAAQAQGLPEAAAATLVAHTLLGASRMLVESGEGPGELRRRVTSPNGTTQAAIETFQAGGFEPLVGRAIEAATARGRELSGS